MELGEIAQLSFPFIQEEIIVLCFFNCPYVARSTDPTVAHSLMEQHYQEKHAQQIERIISGYSGEKKKSPHA